jgi:hypothetical protein
MGETAGASPPTTIKATVTGLVTLAGLLLAAALVLVACSSHGGGGHKGGTGGADGTGGAHSGDTSKTGAKGGSGPNRSVGTFSLEFARCMRANGVPNFPDPNGRGGQLGPDSGIDPASAAFQSAVNGPCRSLAPAEWVSDGPGSAPTGSSQ